MKLYNSETRRVEEFVPYNPSEVTMYTCGPTVYHFAHIGNLRTYIMEDVLEKSLRFLGFNVKRAMNITDVGHLSGDSDDGEDKMVKSATSQNKSVMEIADFYTRAFKADCDKLNIKWPEIVIPATSEVESYIKMIEVLLEKGFAYASGGNIYFDTSKLGEYYRFGKLSADELMVGVRDSVAGDDAKKNKADFVLWFTKSKFENHALIWDSPWGKGYPGWHIECSGISLKYLGEHLDIHCGGVDNKFPHHTNEIAQTEACVGHKWCSFWFHSEHLNDKSGKMSKSKGEFLTLSVLEKNGYHPMMYRMFCLLSHYRNQLVYTKEGMDSAAAAYAKLVKKLSTLGGGEVVDFEIFEKFNKKFKDALSNDLNTSLALTCVYDVLKADTNDSTKIALIASFDEVLSLSLVSAMDGSHELLQETETEISSEMKAWIEEKIAARAEAKKAKDYAAADAIRAELLSRGVEIKDTRDGVEYKIIK
ncbi:MAG: cysteine--tRNA ligase [Clostridia bacterium]|nr:cysteine--tRNA ligase [Clostridia bacterium]